MDSVQRTASCIILSSRHPAMLQACLLLLLLGARARAFRPKALLHHKSPPQQAPLSSLMATMGSSNELKITINPSIGPSNPAHLAVGGPINSLDIYTCQPQTLDLTVGQIACFAAMERRALQGVYTHSVIFASLCRTRVVHMTGWTPQGLDLFYTFEDFKRRADGKDGTPAALKESTHLYKPVGQFPPRAVVPMHSMDFAKVIITAIDIT